MGAAVGGRVLQRRVRGALDPTEADGQLGHVGINAPPAPVERLRQAPSGAGPPAAGWGPHRMIENVVWLKDVGMSDVERVGGKNASLGEMISGLNSQGVRVPGGFATTAKAFESFLDHSDLKNKINELLSNLDITNIQELSRTGLLIRQWVEEAPFPKDLHQSIVESYEKLTQELGSDVTFAVRSSATAEDLPEASFAGQQETYLNVSGIDDILIAVRKVYASLYNDRAISYRVHQGFEHEMVSLSAGIQQMVRSDIGSSGVMFTLDTESGFEDVVFITSAYGLGETACSTTQD